MQNVSLKATVWGYLVSALLIVSRLLSSSQNAGIKSLNSVLIIVILCLCLHLVRRTSSCFYSHVREDKSAFVLFLMPALNLAVTGLGLLSEGLAAVFASPVFSVVLVLTSIPVFLCGYFIYVSSKLPSLKALRVNTAALSALGGIYVIMRLGHTVLFPLLQTRGQMLSENLLKFFSWNTYLSFIIYLLCIASFYFLSREIKGSHFPETEAEK